MQIRFGRVLQIVWRIWFERRGWIGWREELGRWADQVWLEVPDCLRDPV